MEAGTRARFRSHSDRTPDNSLPTNSLSTGELPELYFSGRNPSVENRDSSMLDQKDIVTIVFYEDFVLKI